MNQVRFGLIGFGAWGRHHARAIAECPQAELAAIVAPSPESQAEARRQYPGAAVFAEAGPLLALPEIDVVDVVLPSHLHYPVGAAALRAGRHLLLEKPMALTLADCASLIENAQQQQRLLAIGHEFRLSSLWGKVKEMIDAGAIGNPLYALIELWRNPYRTGAHGWRYDLARVGNWILEEPIHFFDLARWYLSIAGEPASIYARANSRQAGHLELQDNFSAVVTFSGGAYAVISQTLSAFEHHQTVKVTGTRGALWASWSGAMDRTFDPSFSLRYFDGQTVAEVPITRPTGEVYEVGEEIAMMARAVRGAGKVSTTGEDGQWAVRMCLQAQESVNSGKLLAF